MAREQNWREEGTYPTNGCIFQTKRGHVMRWMPYSKNSAQYMAGIEGRWQIRIFMEWRNSRLPPSGSWRGVYNLDVVGA